MNAAPLLEAPTLTRYYPVRRGPFGRTRTLKALDGVSFSLQSAQTLAVVGESGCGKSTLARQLTMIERPTAGSLLVDGQDVAHADRGARRRLRRRVQIVFQDPFGSLNPRKKVGSILAEPLVINTKENRTARMQRVRDMMARVGLRPEHYARYPHMFSGGQRQRIAIARALMASTPHVDPRERRTGAPLKGELPSPLDPPSGCAFSPRCRYATEECHKVRPELRSVNGRLVACHHAESIA